VSELPATPASAAAGPVYLADKSALARVRHPAVAGVLVPLLASGQVATCGVLELEILYSARSHQDFVQVRAELGGYPRLPAAQADFDRAVEVLELLARRGHRRAARLPDLLLAAIAERHGVTLLHYDCDFDLIGAVTQQPMRWIVPRSSVP
jgi:predicted nucleic acid-binding protein